MGHLKARLNDLARSYACTTVSYSEFKWPREQFRTLKKHRNNKSLVITRPDKGSGGGVIIFDNQNYVDNMMSILGDTTHLIDSVLSIHATVSYPLRQNALIQLNDPVERIITHIHEFNKSLLLILYSLLRKC